MRVVAARWLMALALAAALAGRPAAAQSKSRDTSRTIIVDSVRKTYGDEPASQRAAGAPSGAADLTRTVDAEIRVAMFELSAGDSLPALSRLERVASLVAKDSSSVAASAQAALRFLLAEGYYKLGLLDAFRRAAEASLAFGETRYAAVLRPQLLVEAYRSGDYARAVSLARDLGTAGAGGLGVLVGGLAAYQSGDLAAARAAFARASASGPFAPYARYMDALALLRGDTAHAANAVAALESAANAATGTFADQVRLTAAQVAYEGERYGDADRIAASIGEASPLAAPALFTRAWALYKLERVEDAERAFSDFATRYPSRPEHDEAQLMAAQTKLELGRSADAEQVFQRVADSSAVGLGALQAQTNTAIADAARVLVSSHAAELLAVGDPAGAKAVTVRDSLSTSAMMAAITGTPDAGAPSSETSIAPAPAAARLDSIAQRVPAPVQRVLFAPASATRQPHELVVQSQNLASADAAIAVARYRLAEQLEAQQREMALLAQLGASLAGDSAALGALSAGYQTLADSVARLDQLMAAAEARLRDMIGREVEATRSLAAENLKTADSLKAALAPSATAEDRVAIDAEVATAAAYSRIAEMTATGLDKAIAHHPVFVLRDSLRAHNAAARATLANLQNTWTGSRRGVDAELSALRAGDGPGVQGARKALADAEARRASVEGELIAAVTAELSARAGEMVASLERNAEAAQFGVASAAFFRAIDGTRAVGASGGAGSLGTSRARAPERRR
jgi:hypothetical protein